MNNKKRTVLIAALAIFAMIILCCTFFVYSSLYTPESGGVIDVNLTGADGNVILEKQIDFVSGDTLPELVMSNFDNVTIESGMIMSLGPFTTPSDWSRYLCIYVDGEMSSVGINDIEFKDGTVISFVITEYNP